VRNITNQQKGLPHREPHQRALEGCSAIVEPIPARTSSDSLSKTSTTGVTGATSLGSTLNVTGVVTAPSFSGALTGNASTATALQTARTINGVSFDGTSNITVTAAASTLTGTTLNSGVVVSSLTSLGTLTSLGVSGNATVGGTFGATGATTLSSTLAVTGAATLSSTLTINGTTTFNGLPILQTAAGSAQLEFRENDQTLPAGRWRFTADADAFQLRHNTAVAGDFSTYATPISVNASNNTTITGTLTVSSTVTATGGFSGALTGNASTATALQTARTINGVSFNGTADITIPATAPNSLTPGAYLTGSAYDGSAARTFSVDATNANTASKVVARDASGNFSAGVVTTAGNGLILSAAAGSSRRIRYQTSGSERWQIGAEGTAETGSNAGTNFAIQNYDDTGTLIGTPVSISRATGVMTVGAIAGNGAALTSLDADELASGTVPSARLSGSYGISITGNAATATNASTATALQTARTINGVSFNGTANITVADSTKLPLAGGALTGDVTSTGTLRFDSSAFGTIGMRTGAAVGTTPNTSADDFVIESSTTAAGISILNNSAYYGAVFFGDEVSATVGQFRYTHSTDAFTFYTAGTLAMTISSAGLVTAVGGFSGALTGNASTATTLQTARTINGVSFNGSANITVTAAAGTLTGTALNSTVVTSSLTSVGTLASLTVSGGAAVGLDSTVGGIEIGYRNIPRLTTTTLAATSNGKVHAVTAGVTVPASTFAAGDTVAIYNNSAAAITLTQGSGLTLRWAGTASTGNRTLAAYGWASIWFNSATEAVASGNLT